MMTEILKFYDSAESGIWNLESRISIIPLPPAGGVRGGCRDISNVGDLSSSHPHPNPPPQAGEGVKRDNISLSESRIPNPESLIVGEARSWLGTPFRHQGRIKGVGVDCLGLLVGVAKALGLQDGQGRPLAALDELGYGHFPDEHYLQQRLSEALQEVEHPQSGGVGLFCIDGWAQHLGIFGNLESGIENREFSRFPIPDSRFQTLIHAYAPARKVVEHGFTQEWCGRLIRSYQLW